MEEIKFILSTVQPKSTKITQRLITSSDINRVPSAIKNSMNFIWPAILKNKNKSFVF